MSKYSSLGVFMTVALILMSVTMVHAEIPLIRYGYIAGVTNTQRFLMQETPEMFPNLGKTYKVEWLQFRGSPLTIAAAAAGEIELGEASWPPVIKATLKKIPIITVADVNQSIKGKSFSPTWCVLEDSGIKTVQDLKGKKINVVSFGGDYDVYLRMYLKQNGLNPKRDVKIVEISQPYSVTSLRSGTVDMVPLTTPQYFIEKAKGNIRPLFNNNDVIPKIQVIVIYARKSFLEPGEKALRAFLSDYAAAAKYLAEHPKEAILRMIKFKKLDTKYADIVEDFYRDPNAVPSIEGMKYVMGVLYDSGVISEKLPDEKIADLRFLPKH